MTPRRRLAWLLGFAATAACTPPHGPVRPHGVHADPKLIAMTAAPTAGLVQANATTELGVRVRIEAGQLPAARRPPLDLALVLDTSGSMTGASIEAVRASAKQLVARLRDGDRIAVVTFDSAPEVLVASTSVDATTRARVERAIDQIVARGTTDLADGLSAGLAQVQAGRFAQGINRIVLLSDGVPNSRGQLPQLLAATRQRGYAVTTLGLGIDYDTELMTRIARDTGGSFHYLERPEEVAAVFDHELAKMTTVVGRNLQLVLEPGPGVAISTLPGLTPAGGGKFVATIGDLAAGEVRDLMIPIRVTARGEGSTAELVEATLSFDDVIGASGRRQREAYVGARASGDPAAVRASVVIGLEVARVRATAAGAILEAMAFARAGQIDQARQRIAAARAAVEDAIASLHAPELDQIVHQLDEVGQGLAQIVSPRQILGADRASDDRPSDAALVRPAAPSTAPAAVEAQLRRAEERAGAAVRGEAP